MITQEKKSRNFSDILKNLFFVIILLSILPSFFGGIKKQITEMFSPDTKVGCISIGTISDSSYFIKQIHKFQKDSSIKALLLKVDSPGGLPGASQAIFNELKKFKEKKPIVALVGDLSASGGYYVSMAANTIIANPSSLIGSIGVKWTLPNIKELLKRFDIKVEEVKTGKYKTILDPTRDRTPEETALLQNVSDDTYKQFIKDVAEARGLDLSKEKEWADGRIFTGNQALNLKLVDQIGSLSDAQDTIKKLLIAKGETVEENIKLIYLKTSTGLARLFLGDTPEDEESFSESSAKLLSNIWHKFLLNEGI